MEILRHEFEKTVLWYLVNENKKITMLMIPCELEGDVKKAWDIPNDNFDARARYIHQWNIGSLAKLHLSHHDKGASAETMKCGQSVKELYFKGQSVEEEKDFKCIKTRLISDEGYEVLHVVTAYNGYNAFTVDTTFENHSDRTFTLEFLTSFSLDNLSPFQSDDAPYKYAFHRFKSGWSSEGKHICADIEDLSMEKPYSGVFIKNEKFASLGGYPVEGYFPVAVVEDKEYGACWAAQLEHNSSWQMELTRGTDTLSFSGGLADAETGLWWKNVAPGESFKAPRAYVCATKSAYSVACQTVTALMNMACDQYGEEGLPVCYNEFCTSWGTPTQEKMLQYAESLKDKGVRYVVIDAGWSKGCFNGQGGNGEWIVNEEIFPDMRQMCEKIRAMGMIPGIWFEFEVTTTESPVYENREYDDMHMKRNGVVINTGGWRTFWDMRKPEVVEYLSEKVIKFLKDNLFGYIKVDYNANPGIGCDGAESPGEGMRAHMQASAKFFEKIKKEIPDIIIENCASGGHRLEPQMLGVSAVSSFSDAHEAIEIPYIAANLHNLILPRQSLVWAVVHSDDSEKRIAYSMAAGMLGRICLSGEVENLSEAQWRIIEDAFRFYENAVDIIKYGVTEVYGNRGKNMRYPTGTQVVVRETKDEMLVIVHAFENPSEEIEINVFNTAEISNEFFNKGRIELKDSKLIIHPFDEFSAAAVIVKK